LIALGRALRGRGFGGAAVMESVPEWAMALLNALPEKLRLAVYKWSGWLAAPPLRRAAKVREEEISAWVASQYPDRTCPAIWIGSTNGALIHAAAALRIPWLPQTFLLTYRRYLPPDELMGDLRMGQAPARVILQNNPSFKLYQMHDPVNDRLMVERIMYFRAKRTKLGPEYERFIRERLRAGGEIVLIECGYRWPATRVGPRHTFQVGGLGELKPGGYGGGTPEIREFLKKQNARVENWQMPPEDGEGPEAEWGFEPELRGDVERFARANGFRLRRMIFEEPEALSPLVADLYRWWYGRRGIPARHLVAECFALLEPWEVLRRRCIPFWMAFNTDPSYRALRRYLESRSFEEIHLMLMSNGVRALGQVPIGRWKSLLKRAGRRGDFLGVDPKRYPSDLASFTRYHTHFVKKIPKVAGPVPVLTAGEFDEFMAAHARDYDTTWI
jgi:hypothetical protein